MRVMKRSSRWIPVAGFIKLVESGLPEEPIPRWAKLLTGGDEPLEITITKLSRPYKEIYGVYEMVEVLRDLLLARVVIWLFFTPDPKRGKVLEILRENWVSVTESYLNWPWTRAARTINCLLDLPARDTIFVFPPPDCILEELLKRRVRTQESNHAIRSSEEPVAIYVPAPSLKLGTGIIPRCGTVAPSEDADHELYLREALSRVADTVPCGNPINAMVSSLCFESGIMSSFLVLPIGLESSSGLACEVALKILSVNILNSAISLPLISPSVVSAVVQKRANTHAVMCRDCGHCLNFGRGKFKTVNFKPTSIFYCRDRKEKQFTVCSSTGRIYCNFCGSQAFRTLPLSGQDSRGRPFLRAILANNAASCLGDHSDQKVTVVVPCLASPTCSGSCIKEPLSVPDLIYLTQSLENFDCLRCKGCV